MPLPGICVTMLPHLSTLSDLTVCMIEEETQRDMHAEMVSFRKRKGEKVQQIERNCKLRQKRLIGVSAQI